MNLRKVFQGVLAGAMIVSMSALYAYAEDSNTSTEDYSGVCGDNLTYEITQIDDKDAYRITISGEGAMYDYEYGSNEAPWRFLAYKIEEVVIEEGVTSVGSDAFYYCIAPNGNQYPVVLPDTLTDIGDFAFFGISSIETFNISIPKNVQNIGVGAFATGMIVESDVGAFEVDEDNAYFCAEDGVLYSKDLSVLVAYPRSRKDFKVREGTKYIGDFAFAGMYTVESQKLILPEGLLGIGVRAFYGDNIYDVLFPDSLTTIASHAFCNCSLTKVFIPKTVENIGSGAFASNSENLLIYGGETAEQYADEEEYDFRSLTEDDFIPVYGFRSYHTSNLIADGEREITFEFTDVTENADIKGIIENLTEDAQCYVYDIKMLCNEEVFQPYTAVSIYIRLEDTMSRDNLSLYRQETDGSLSKLDYSIWGDFLVFETDHFSLYVIVNDEVKNENTDDHQEEISKTPDDTSEENSTQGSEENSEGTITETEGNLDDTETIPETLENTSETIGVINQQESNANDNSADTGDENWKLLYAVIVTLGVMGALTINQRRQYK